MSVSFLHSRSRAWSALAVWMAVIFAFSSMPGSGSAGSLPLRLLLERKGAHVFEYLILAMLAFNAFRLTFSKERPRSHVLLAMAFSLFYAFTDETHQLFVFGREGKLSDVGIDLMGIVLGVSVAAYLGRVRPGSRQSR